MSVCKWSMSLNIVYKENNGLKLSKKTFGSRIIFL